MGRLTGRWIRGAMLAPLALMTTGLAFAQEDADLAARLAALEETVAGSASAYVDNSYLFLIGGILVMFMTAGFCMLEAGLVRAKNAAMQVTKNITLFSVAGLMWWVVGYNLGYPGEFALSGLISGVLPGPWSPGDLSLESEAGYSPSSDWFFQMVFVATAASIVSGTIAERTKLVPFLLFTAVLTAIIYPIVIGWGWNDAGYLVSTWGFSDFAGSTLVHSTGGWAALTGALIIGARKGKYVGKQVNPMPGSNIPLAALGTFILWFGWFGFNGASELAAGSPQSINNVAQVFANTNMAAVGGVLSATLVAAVMYKGKIDATLVMNGALGGLVSITAEPLAPSMGLAVLIGAIGGVLVVVSVPVLDKLKIDDVVGAIPVHLVCGIWGTLAVVLSNGDASFVGQLMGILMVAVWVGGSTAVIWFLLKLAMGLRPTEEEEVLGLDRAEIGLEAYPEFASR